MSRWVGRNAIINIVGVVLPSLAGIVALRVLLDALGQAAMGVFTIAFGLLGLTSILDFGLGKGITRYVATSLGGGESAAEISGVVRKGLYLLAAVGTIAAAAFWVSLPLLVGTLTGDHAYLLEQALKGFRWVALSIPFALVASGMLSVLEGYQRFSRANVVRIPMGFLVFIAPATVAVISGNLLMVLAALALVRVVGFLLSYAVVRPLLRNPRSECGKSSGLSRVLKFSGWLSISNIAGPILIYGDRFYLATVVPTSSIAYYTIPFDVAFRATTLPSAGMSALFPALAHANSSGLDKGSLVKVARETLLLLWLPPLAIACLLSKEILTVWLGAEFASHAWAALLTLLVGVFVNGFALLAASVLHADGRSDITAKLHLFELPIYAVAAVLLIMNFGVVGAALAWSFRVTMDFILLCLAMVRTGGAARSEVSRLMISCLSTALVIGSVGAVASEPARILLSTGVALASLWYVLRNTASILAIFGRAKGRIL